MFIVMVSTIWIYYKNILQNIHNDNLINYYGLLSFTPLEKNKIKNAAVA